MSNQLFEIKCPHAKILARNKHVTKERGNIYGKVENYKCKTWAWWEN